MACILLAPGAASAQEKPWTMVHGKPIAPATAWPDEKIKVSLLVGGGPAGQEFEAVLEARRVSDRDGKPTAGDRKFSVTQRGKFNDKSRSVIEFNVDVGSIQQAKGDKESSNRVEGTWEIKIKLPRHPGEKFDLPFHETDTIKLLVQHQKLRVLIWSDVASREYQFVNHLFKSLSSDFDTYVCNAAADPDAVALEPERWLKEFPSRLGPDLPGKKNSSLSSFDLVIALDPNWSSLKPEQIKTLERWVRRQSGGLIFSAGPVHTLKLAKPDPLLGPVQDMLPVILKDVRTKEVLDRPWPLKFTSAVKHMPFLEKETGWEQFFWGEAKKPAKAEQEPMRGMFYCAAVDKARDQADVLATFGKPNPRGDEQPYLATMRHGTGQTFFIGSGETWRLRQYRESAHEHFWVKLARYVAANNLVPRDREAPTPPVQVLVIDGDAVRDRKDDRNDAYWIKAALDAIPDEPYQVVLGHELAAGPAVKALERDDLSKFAAILLLNVRELKDKQLTPLEKYTEAGGGVGFFLGPKVASDYYNRYLYKQGKGLFPAPLETTYYPSRNEPKIKRSVGDGDMVVLRFDLFPDAKRYPVFGPIFGDPAVRGFLQDMPVGRYFKVPLEQWKPYPANTFILASLPADQPVADFARDVRSVFYSQDVKAILLDKANADYAGSLERHRTEVTVMVAPNSKKKPHHLARAIDNMLNDRGKANDPDRPDLKAFWASKDAKVQKFREAATALMNRARYGDPLVIGNRFGKGRVLAVLTTAGPEWNDLALGFMYQPFIWESVNFLAAAREK